MTEGELLRRVLLPLAMPVIVAGLRTAAVWVVGTATLSTPVGATSLGNFIFSGLQTRNHAAVLVGCGAAAALALLLDFVIRTLETGLREGRRRSVAGGLLLLGALAAWAAASFAAPGAGLAGRTVVIGAKTFTEQYVLSELLAARIAQATGLRTLTLPSLGSTVLFDALRSSEIDVYVDYSGTIWATLMRREEAAGGRAAVLAAVEEFLRAEHGIRVAAALGFENTYALGMREDHARRLGIERISQLVPHAARLEMGADYEFFQRPEWKSLQRAYGLAFGAQRSMDSSLMYQAVAGGQVDVISAFSTDGRIAAQDIRLLEDDRGAIPPYDAIVLVGPRLAREHPEVLAALAALDGAIDAERMRRANLAVDRAGRSPAQVARELLGELAPASGGR
jgi:osmoprotectant transport system permease protein